MIGGYQMLDLSHIKYELKSTAEPTPVFVDLTTEYEILENSNKPIMIKLPTFTGEEFNNYDFNRECFPFIYKTKDNNQYNFLVHFEIFSIKVFLRKDLIVCQIN